MGEYAGEGRACNCYVTTIAASCQGAAYAFGVLATISPFKRMPWRGSARLGGRWQPAQPGFPTH